MIFFSFSCWTSSPFFSFFHLRCSHLHFHYRLKHLHVTSVNVHVIKVSAEGRAKKGTSCYTGCGFWPLCPDTKIQHHLSLSWVSLPFQFQLWPESNFNTISKGKKEKQKNTVYHDKLIAEKVSIELSFHRISSADSKVDCRTTLQVSIIHSRIGMKGTLGGVYMRKHTPARVSYREINDWVISYLRWGFQSSISTPIMSNFGSKTIWKVP